MRKILVVLLLLGVMVSCSEDESTPNEQSPEFPENLSLIAQKVAAEDTITIRGEHFSDQEIYTVTFAKNKTGKLIETQSEVLKVQVPKEAQSGEVRLTYKNRTEVVGTVVIIEFPKVTHLSKTSLNTGDLLTIHGSGFLTDEKYTVTFTDSVIGALQEITENTIQVVVPENAESGTVTLTYNGETKEIGAIEIIQKGETRLFAYVAYDKIVELNPEDGTEIETIATVGADYLGKLNYSPINDELIGLQSYGAVTPSYDFTRIHITTGEVSRTELKHYEDLVMTAEGKLYAYVAYDKIVELNPEDGTEIGTIATLGADYFGKMVYAKATHELIGLQSYGTTTPGYDLTKINIATGEVSRIVLKHYEDLVMTTEGKLYAYVAYDKIVELNPEDGSEITTIATLGADYFGKMVYAKATHELIGLQSYGTTTPGYDFTKINIATGEVSRTELKHYEDLIIKN
ncbi:hypothetical protein HN014_02565 [Aquimarina sp. TRL1]|uniref:IPT/TIG domain-containing protein n=1 Tax=Aquimarina sp. (strain TRL1) TaxID=2736252 RepID=UPI00158EDB0B|nr:IPT/TIG domain-containing protein [Aquimarina sp. TRL1]QKX03835.1 hypothetical protein HN014_02565 [Aquimarina sp. TRL1]